MRTSGEVGESRRPRLTYLLAASHSGSTLLAMLLGSHPELCSVGELNASALGDVRRYRCSCGALILECEFWRRLSQEMGRRDIPFDITAAGTDIRIVSSWYVQRLLQPLHRGPTLERVRDVALSLSPRWRAHLVGVQRRSAILVASLCALTGAHSVVDSSKSGICLKYLLRNPDLDVHVVRLIRDGRAVTLTHTDPAQFADARAPELRGGGMGGDRSSERLSVSQAAHEWRRCNEEAEEIVRQLDPACWIQVQYETLCTAPAATLQRLFAFLGVDPGFTPANFRSREHHVIGNGMRLDSSSVIQLDDRWRTALTPGDLDTFEAVAGVHNRRLGYT